MKKILAGLLLLSAVTLVRADVAAEDSYPEETLPGAGHIMIEMGYRYSVLYFAAQQKNWDFAAYQLEEMEEALQRLAYLKPKHWGDIGHFRATVIEDLEKALTAHNPDRFMAGFDKMRAECTACHARNNVGFIRLPIPKKHFSPVLE